MAFLTLDFTYFLYADNQWIVAETGSVEFITFTHSELLIKSTHWTSNDRADFKAEASRLLHL